MNKPKVSIIIPVYNGADYMREAIDSALNQTYKNCEIIVVNDGSSDDGLTEAIALSYGEKIRYFAKSNGGVATALNFGIEHMTGEYFCWLSHDDYYFEEKISHQIDTISTLNYDTILYGGYVLKYEENGLKIPVNFANKFSAKDLDKPLFPVFRGLINGCTTMIHRSHFQQAGLFEPSLRTTQDYNLWFRMLRYASVHYCGTCDVVMRQHDKQGSKTIGSHEIEASKLWIWMDKQLFDYERADILGTPHLFYQSTYEFLKPTCYTEAIEYYAEKSNKPEQFEAETDVEKVKLIETLIRNYETIVSSEKSVERSELTPMTGKGSMFKRLKLAVSDLGVRGTIKKCFRFLAKKLLFINS